MSCIKEVLLPVDADEAWDAVTEPDALELWLADEVELDLREGGEATFVLPGGERRTGDRRGGPRRRVVDVLVVDARTGRAGLRGRA